MAGKIKVPGKSSEALAASTDGAAPEAIEAPKPPPPSGAEKAMLFKKAFAYDDTVTQLEEQIKSVKDEKSVAVKAVLDACGKGPFSYRGREITISSRGETYFFKDYGKHNLDVIEG